MAPDDDDLRGLWQGREGQAEQTGKAPAPEALRSTTTEAPFPLEELRRREAQLTRRVRIRNASELIAAGILLVWCAVSVVSEPLLSRRFVSVLTAIAVLSVARKIRRDGAPRPAPPAGASTAEHLAHLRAELGRQRGLLQTVPRWYLAPLSSVIFLAYAVDFFTLHQTLSSTARLLEIAPVVLGTAAFILFVAWLNRRAASKLPAKIDALGD